MQTERSGGTAPNGILHRFTCLLSAHWIREVLQTIFLVYLARKSTATYGQFMVALGLGQVLLFISEFGINQSLVSILVRKETEPSRALAQVTALKAALLALGWLGTVGFLFWQEYAPALKAVALILGTGVGLEALASTFSVYCQVQGRQDLEGRVRALSAAVGFGYGIAALLAGLSPIALAFYKLIETVANIAGMAFIARRTLHRGLFRSGFREIWGTARASVSFTLIAVASILYNKANLFFLQRYAGEEAVAQYSVTWQMVDGICCIVVNLLLRNVLFPLFSGLWTGDRKEFGRIAEMSASWLLAASLPIMFVLACESDRIIGLIYGPGYADAIWMQKILVATILIGFLHNLASFMMMSMKRERLLLLFHSIGLAFNLACCAALIPDAPLMGTVVSITATKLLVALLTVSYCQRRLGFVASRPILQLVPAVLAGAALYALLSGPAPREAAEAAAIVPVLAVALRWRRGLQAQKAREAPVI